MLGGHSAVDPPDSMPNSEVKRSSADGSVGSPHVRVGHRQAPILSPSRLTWAFLRLQKTKQAEKQSRNAHSPSKLGSHVRPIKAE